jgi:hypothetical protein
MLFLWTAQFLVRDKEIRNMKATVLANQQDPAHPTGPTPVTMTSMSSSGW